MIRWELGNGKTILLTQAQFNKVLDDDLELERILAEDQGVFIEDVFEEIKVKEFKEISYPEEPKIEDLPDEIINDIKKEFDGT
jgi:hypothetical protein